MASPPSLPPMNPSASNDFSDLFVTFGEPEPNETMKDVW